MYVCGFVKSASAISVRLNMAKTNGPKNRDSDTQTVTRPHCKNPQKKFV